MKIVSAPLFALYSRNFYRQVVGAPMSRGFLYLMYLSAITTLALLVFLITRGLPQADQFVNWLKSEMPAMVWTPDEGLKIDGQSPYSLVHPMLGTFIVFDTTKDVVMTEELGEAPIFVTSKRIYLRQGPRPEDVAVYDMTRTAATIPEGAAPVRITSELIQTGYGSIKPWIFVLATLFFLPFYFLWQVAAALFYSLVGLLINLLRKPRLSYGSVLRVSMFALTAATVISILKMLIPPLGAVPFGLLGTFLVTSLYLVLGIKWTEGGGEPAS